MYTHTHTFPFFKIWIIIIYYFESCLFHLILCFHIFSVTRNYRTWFWMSMLFHQIVTSSFINHPPLFGHLGYLLIFIFFVCIYTKLLYLCQNCSPWSLIPLPKAITQVFHWNYPCMSKNNQAVTTRKGDIELQEASVQSGLAVPNSTHKCILDNSSTSKWVDWAFTWVCKSAWYSCC